MVICLELGADLHMAQLMLLPLTVSCFSKIQIGFAFLVPAHPGSPGQRAVKRVCVFVCVYKLYSVILAGPGLAIRVICAEEPYMEKDFAETSNMLKTIVDYSNAVKKVVVAQFYSHTTFLTLYSLSCVDLPSRTALSCQDRVIFSTGLQLTSSYS